MQACSRKPISRENGDKAALAIVSGLAQRWPIPAYATHSHSVSTQLCIRIRDITLPVIKGFGDEPNMCSVEQFLLALTQEKRLWLLGDWRVATPRPLYPTSGTPTA